MEKNKIICKHCASEFSDTLPKCPFCGNLNYEGVKTVPSEAQEKIRKQLHLGIKVLVIIICVVLLCVVLIRWINYRIDKGQRENIIWANENIPKLEALYEQEKYDELLELYDSYEMFAPRWMWEHFDFADTYRSVVEAKEIMQKEMDGYELTEDDYAALFYYQWCIKSMKLRLSVEEDEVTRIEELSGDILEDFENRFNMSKDEIEAFEKKIQDEYHGLVDYNECEEYIKKWYAE